MIKVEGYSNLYRDEKSGAIVNHNTLDYNRRLNSISSFNNQKNEMDRMKEDINELKGLLKVLLEKSTV
tara:strand:- start:1005 stop:1208 length:204 start_codon:yes stop_codon:yes gene_type:complete